LKSLTVWITPFTLVSSLSEAIDIVHQLADTLGTTWEASLLLPTNFGAWPQSHCTQSLPGDMRVGSVDDVGIIRQRVESTGLGFGVWFVPVACDDPRAPGVDIPELCARMAVAGGYAAANFEPDVFWRPGDDPAMVDEFWQRFWDAMAPAEQAIMSGNVCATVVPNPWGIGAFRNSLPNLAAGCGALALEVYGGLQTAAQYPSPDLWPADGFREIRATGVDANLIPILARANLTTQLPLANRLGHGNVHVWAC